LRRTGTTGGFSLIETLIGLALVGLSVSLVATISTYSARSNRYIRAMTSLNDLVSEIKMITDSERTCTANFRGIAAPTGTSKTNVTVSGVDPSGNLTSLSIAKPGNLYENVIQVVSVTLQSKLLMPNNEQLLKLILVTQKTGDLQGPGQSLTELPILATIDAAGKILSCKSNFQYNGLGHVEEKICELAGQIYDPINRVCVTPMNCNEGTAFTATCTDTTQSAIQCNSTGYVDGTPPQIPRGYQDGSTRLGGPPPFFGTPAGNTCTCVYADGVDTTNAHCIVCCRGT
jgi:type II secretory pathway pseudopilin PulG